MVVMFPLRRHVHQTNSHLGRRCLRRSRPAGLAVVLAVVVAACGSSRGASMHPMMESSGEANAPVRAGAREISIRGTSFDFTPKDIKISANENVTIAFTASDAEHDVTVEGVPGVGHIVHAQQGKTARGGLKISAPGTYTFYCSVSGHRKAGMVGTVTVS